MRFGRTISLLALAALLVGAASPAFAQRDTRPEERPQIEKSEHHDERDDRSDDGRLPKGTPGTTCELVWEGDQINGVLLSNDTGKTIPVGTVITVYIQPGNIQKQFKVTADWHAGTVVDVTIDVGAIQSIAACSIKVKPERNSKELPQPSEKARWYDGHEVAFGCSVGWDGTVEPNQLYVQMWNDSDVAIPAGTKLVFVLPSGEWMTYVLETDWAPKTAFRLPLTYSSERADYYSGFNSRVCTYTKVETGDLGPAVEEQGPVPGIDPAKVP